MENGGYSAESSNQSPYNNKIIVDAYHIYNASLALSKKINFRKSFKRPSK